MKTFLNKLEKIVLEGNKIETFEMLPSDFELGEKADNNQILEVYNFFNKKIPKDYLEFLSYFNGGTLFKIEDFAGYKLLNTEELISENLFQKSTYENDWDEKVILFCLIIGDNEYLGFREKAIGKYEIIHCIMDYMPNEWIYIASSLEELILDLIEKRGKKYWLENNL